MLGGKGLESFLWSAAHDDDAEFFRRYSDRAALMIALHGDEPGTQAAIERVQALITQ